MKIICASNFDDENFNESVVAENIKDEAFGKIMTGALNSHCDPKGPDYYKLVGDDHKLNKFEP